MDTSGPCHLDGTNFLYWSARMACCLKTVYLGVWIVTRNGMKPLKTIPRKPSQVDLGVCRCIIKHSKLGSHKPVNSDCSMTE